MHIKCYKSGVHVYICVCSYMPASVGLCVCHLRHVLARPVAVLTFAEVSGPILHNTVMGHLQINDKTAGSVNVATCDATGLWAHAGTPKICEMLHECQVVIQLWQFCD